MAKQKYGVVYTPDLLSSFVALLLTRMAHGLKIKNVLDPASGECSLLKASQNILGEECNYIGIDIDKSAVEATKNSFNVLFNDFILPFNVRKKTSEYWKEKRPPIDAIIANPPWSSEKIYEMATLKKAGYDLAAGQYDSYVLFIEQSYNVLCDNGVMAFILPDSIFDTQNETLRKFLVEKMQIKVIARLGEKIFEELLKRRVIVR